jgi:hypothetical protein
MAATPPELGVNLRISTICGVNVLCAHHKLGDLIRQSVGILLDHLEVCLFFKRWAS